MPNPCDPNPDFDRRLAVAEKKLFEDLEPRLTDVELDKAVETFVAAQDAGKFAGGCTRGVPSQSDQKTSANAGPTTVGKQINVTVEDHVERLDDGGGESLRKDEKIDRELGCTEMEMDVANLKDRVQRLEVQVQSMTKDAITKELKAELLREFPQLSRSLATDRDSGVSVAASAEDMEDKDTLPVNVTPSLAWRATTTETCNLVDKYDFQENVWDLSLFIGLPQIGLFGSIWSCMLLLANFSLQVSMILIVNEVFTATSIDEDTVVAMRHWRVFFGHSYDLADWITRESLSSRVCTYDSSLPYSSGVLETLTDISEYIPTSRYYEDKQLPFGHLAPHFEYVGPLLCLIAILIWLLEIVAQCDKLFHLAIAFRRLPESPTYAHECLSLDDSCSVTVTSLSAHRRAWCYALIIAQLMVILPLAAMGVRFMLATINMRDLLLNCSALAIIHDTDELFYAALAPRAGRILIRALTPLPRGPSRTLHGLNWKETFATVCILCTIAYALVPLINLVQILRDTHHEICGGRQNFVAVRDTAGIVSATQANIAYDRKQLEATYSFQATRQLVVDKTVLAKWFASDGSMSGALTGLTGSSWSVQTQRERNVVEVMEWWNSACTDMLPPSTHRYAQYFLQIFRDDFQKTSTVACGDVRMYCSGDDLKGTRSRQFCPVTCGCSNRTSSLAIEGIIGCPPSCVRSPQYNASMGSKACVDEGINSSYWNIFFSGLRGLQASYPANWATDFDPSIKTLQDYGCNVITGKHPLAFVGPWDDPCVTSRVHVKSLIFACPISCGCHITYRVGCPSACFAVAVAR